MESKDYEPKYFLGNEVAELVPQLLEERDSAEQFAKLLFRLRRAGVKEFGTLELLFHRLYVDLDSISALILRDAVSPERDEELHNLITGGKAEDDAEV